MEKVHRSTIYAAKANSIYVFLLLMLPPHIISCVASILSSFTLSLELSPYTVVIPHCLYTFHTCCCFFRVLLFICLTVCYYSKFSYSFLEVAVSTSHIFLKACMSGINSTTKTTKTSLLLCIKPESQQKKPFGASFIARFTMISCASTKNISTCV